MAVSPQLREAEARYHRALARVGVRASVIVGISVFVQAITKGAF